MISRFYLPCAFTFLFYFYFAFFVVVFLVLSVLSRNFRILELELEFIQNLLTIYFADKTKPEVTGCPRDIVHTLTGFSAIITWNEPVFTDNVKIDRIEYPIRRSGERWTYGQSALLQYRAIDTSGNSVKCTFRVTIKSK